MRTGCGLIVGMLLLTGLAARGSQPPNREASLFTANDNYGTNMARQHVFMVGPHGNFIDPPSKWGWVKGDPHFHQADSFGCISNGIKTWLAKPDTIERSIKVSPRIVVFVHGGLNSYTDTRDRLQNVELMCSLARSNCYPIFISWDSSLLSSYGQHLCPIRQGEEHKTIAILTLPWVFFSDLAIGMARLPQTLSGRYYNDFETTELSNGGRATRWEGFESLIHSNRDNYHPPAPEGKIRTVQERSVRMTEYILTSPTKILTLPIVDGMGTEAWSMMIRRTRTMFEPPSSYEIRDKLEKWGTDKPDATNFQSVSNWLAGEPGGMFCFAKILECWTTNTFTAFSSSTGNTNIPWPGLTFDFYGHSMGAIVLNELFRNQPGIKAGNIGYMAAACSVMDFETALFPYLKTNHATQFYSVSLHRMRERDEYCLASVGYVRRIPVLRDLIVRGSLLNWIDDIFEKPSTINDRTLGSWDNVTRALPDMPEELWSQLHFRDCSLEKLDILAKVTGTKEPQVHADFTRSIFWNHDFYWPDGTNQFDLF